MNPSVAGVGRALWGSPSPAPCPSRVTQSRLHSTASSQGWNISREGDSTASLGSLGQGSVTLRGKKFFLMFSWNFLCSSLCPLPLVLSLGTTEKSGSTCGCAPDVYVLVFVEDLYLMTAFHICLFCLITTVITIISVVWLSKYALSA